MSQNAATSHKFEAEVSQVLSLVINSLYSNKEIFLRELISNAADALNKLRFESISRPELTPSGHEPRIRLIPDEKAGTLTVWDNGIGMTKDELIKQLGTVAHSGSRAFLERLQQAQDVDSVSLIGQFGVGFYSAYLVADRVDVLSRAAGGDEAYLWSSGGTDGFTIAPAERDEPGTSVVLHLQKEYRDFLKSWKLRELVTRYSDYISQPIEVPKYQSDEDREKGKPLEYERANQASALWRRSPKSISKEQYNEFYKHLTHDWEEPLARTHFSVEGKQMFAGLLFIPQNVPIDMQLRGHEARHGVRLYVKQVFIMDDCEELLPRWLRFVRGVIDSEDLPLNVSRELLQDSHVVRTIRKQIVRRVLDRLASVAKDNPEQYDKWWRRFGAVLKEGLHFDPEYKDRIAKLLRYESTKAEGLTSLQAYRERMSEEQPAIYYVIGTSREVAASSPQLEALRERGFEVLLMTDNVDQWAVQGLKEYDGKPLVNVMDEDLKLDGSAAQEEDSEDKADEASRHPELASLLERFKTVLDDKVSEVRVSERLRESPVCLVIPKGGMPAHIERLLRIGNEVLTESKRVLEINPEHAVIKGMKSVLEDNGDSSKLDEWIELLFDQALLAEGSPIHDPGRFASRMTELLQSRIDSSH